MTKEQERSTRITFVDVGYVLIIALVVGAVVGWRYWV